jgi:molecular chaperone GrpE
VSTEETKPQSPEGTDNNAPEEHVENPEATDASEAASDGETELSTETLLAQIDELNAKLQEADDKVLRASAEAQNARRRADQDVEKARKFALEKFAGDMLPVADNLERAIQAFDAADESTKPLLEGVELTLKTLIDALGRHHLVAVEPEGEPFDPNLHQAMSMIENPDVEPNTVLNVFQKGYTLNGRLIRPAMVVVSKASS